MYLKVLLSAAGGALPVVSLLVDTGILIGEKKWQKKQLGLDFHSMKKKAEVLGKTVPEFLALICKKNDTKIPTAIIKMLIDESESFIDGINVSKIMQFLFTTGADITGVTGVLGISEGIETAIKIGVPVIGSAIGALISGTSTYVILSRLLETNHTLAKLTLRVMKEELEMDHSSTLYE